MYLEKIADIFRNILGDDNLVIQPGFSMHENPEWDSVAMVQILLALESEFQMRFALEDVASIRTVEDIQKLLELNGC